MIQYIKLILPQIQIEKKEKKKYERVTIKTNNNNKKKQKKYFQINERFLRENES